MATPDRPAGAASRSAARRAAAAAAGAGGVARSNPTAMSYPPDAYADADDDGPYRDRAPLDRGRRRPPRRDDDDDDRGTSPVVWLAGLVAIALLAAVAFLVVQLLSGPGRPTAGGRGERAGVRGPPRPTAAARPTISASSSHRPTPVR